MKDKFKDKYRTTPARLSGWDYGSHGVYFVTICTREHIRYFGEVADKNGQALLMKTEIGEVAHNYWQQINEHFPFVEIDQFVIMPDHIHGIIFINRPDKTEWQVNKFGKQSQNLASIIRAYKSTVKRYANVNSIEFIWQSGYYDRVIRNEKEHKTIRQYIYDNPEKWILNAGKDDELILL